MARGLDHIVHAVHNLDAAADLYRRMGFTVGARNKHPWGTHNHIVQLPGFFIELLTVGEPEKLGDDGFSKLFGRYNQDFLSRGEGLSLLILESKDASADKEAFANAGISLSDVMRFEREGKRPDGSTVKVAFSLTFATDPGAPDIRFCTCQQHYPENFWNPAFQNHKNGSGSVAGVVIVAAKPADHRFFLRSFSGANETESNGVAFTAKTDRGEITIIDPMGFNRLFGNASPPAKDGARLAAVRFEVSDLTATEELLRSANIPFNTDGGQAVVSDDAAFGATIVFAEPAR
jgi:hypothetical protein